MGLGVARHLTLLFQRKPPVLYPLIALFAFCLALLFTPAAIYLGRRWELVDRPGGRRRHQGVIPRTGGLILFATFTVTILLVLLLPKVLPPALADWFPPRNDPKEMRRLIALLIGGAFCALAGLADDRWRWSSGPQYLVQFGASLLAMAGLIFIKHVNNPFADGLFFGPAGFPWWIVGPLTIFWFMGMMNTVNFLDGLNGLVAGVTAILCGVLTVHMLWGVEPPQQSVAVLPAALLGSALGFLLVNFVFPRLFMGSSGSYFLGFVIAAIGIMGGARLATVMLVLGLPALDVAWLILQRWRRGLSAGQDGRDHLHFRLQDRGLSQRVIVVGYWLFCATFGALTLLLDDRLYKLAALAILGVLALGVLVWAGQEKD